MMKRLAPPLIVLLLIALAVSWPTARPEAQGTTVVNTELPAPLAATDSMTNPTAPWTLSALMCWTGSTWTRCPSSTTNAGAADANTPRSVTASDSPEVATLGATSDAAATAGSTGSLSAKLRLATTQLDSLVTAAFIDPCGSVAKTTTPISVTADTLIITATSAKKNYICSLVVVAGAAEIVGITEGTGSTCGTGEAALLGSTTDANSASFAANGGVSMIGGSATVIAGKTSNVNTCIKVSAGSVRVSGFVTWVQQ
jgi:hypothetical protein